MAGRTPQFRARAEGLRSAFQALLKRSPSRFCPGCREPEINTNRATILLAQFAAALTILLPAVGSPAADETEQVLWETHWGASSEELLRQFGVAAIRLPRAVDFGDSYADVVLAEGKLGGVPVVVFFQ